MLSAGLKDVLPKDVRNNKYDLRMNVVIEEMMLVGVREVNTENVVRWREMIICGNA